MSWDRQAAARLECLRRQVDGAGVTDLLKQAAAEVWRANRERYEPDELFDDPFTLSMLSSRNLANRLFQQINSDSAWGAKRVTVLRESLATVIRVGAIEVRLVKAPHRMGREPDFSTAFSWDRSEHRANAARRNSEVYRPENGPALFQIDGADVIKGVDGCRDVFVVWGAELTSGLTAGWIGLPAVNPGGSPWLAVAQLWWDTVERRQVSAEPTITREATNDFRSGAIPVPRLQLKSVAKPDNSR